MRDDWRMEDHEPRHFEHRAIIQITLHELRICWREKLSQIKAAALADAEMYTLNKMVEQFVDGISQCLAQ